MGNRLIAWTEKGDRVFVKGNIGQKRVLRTKGAEDIELCTLQDKRRSYMAWNGGS